MLEDKIQNPSHYLFWFPSDAMLWIESSGDGWFLGRVLNPRDQFMGRIFQIFEMFVAKIASALNKIVP